MDRWNFCIPPLLAYRHSSWENLLLLLITSIPQINATFVNCVSLSVVTVIIYPYLAWNKKEEKIPKAGHKRLTCWLFSNVSKGTFPAWPFRFYTLHCLQLFRSRGCSWSLATTEIFLHPLFCLGSYVLVCLCVCFCLFCFICNESILSSCSVIKYLLMLCSFFFFFFFFLHSLFQSCTAVFFLWRCTQTSFRSRRSQIIVSSNVLAL